MIVDPRLNEQPSTRRHPEYAENGCARRPGLYFRAVWLPSLLFLGIVVAIALGNVVAEITVPIFFLFFAFLSTTTLMCTLPLGIRMDQQGIRIGGVQAAEEGRSRVRPRDKPIQGFTRAMHVYSCDWEGVKAIKVLTDPQDLAVMARGINGRNDRISVWWGHMGMESWAPGRFILPQAGGALVIEVETARASFQPTRPSRLSDASLIYDRPRMRWVIPTNNPMAIKAALAAAQPPVYED